MVREYEQDDSHLDRGLEAFAMAFFVANGVGSKLSALRLQSDEGQSL